MNLVSRDLDVVTPNTKAPQALNNLTMKTVILSLLAATVAAFAPSQSAQRQVVGLSATAELEGLIGTDIETGKKIVSSLVPNTRWSSNSVCREQGETHCGSSTFLYVNRE